MKEKRRAAGMEDSVLTARIEDAVRLCELRNYPHFVGFLDERQAAMAEKIAKGLRFERYMLWGGYDDAQRVIFGAFPRRFPSKKISRFSQSSCPFLLMG